MTAGAPAAIPDGPYRPCVGVALFNDRGQVFIGRRKGLVADEAWQMPQGGIDPGETPLEAALRELREETGVSSVRLLGESEGWLAYDLPPAMLRPSWKGRYRGQTQKWFAFRLTGPESEIDVLEPAGGHAPEFDAWRWEALERTPELIISFKREVYREVAKTFAGFTNST